MIKINLNTEIHPTTKFIIPILNEKLLRFNKYFPEEEPFVLIKVIKCKKRRLEEAEDKLSKWCELRSREDNNKEIEVKRISPPPPVVYKSEIKETTTSVKTKPQNKSNVLSLLNKKKINPIKEIVTLTTKEELIESVPTSGLVILDNNSVDKDADELMSEFIKYKDDLVSRNYENLLLTLGSQKKIEADIKSAEINDFKRKISAQLNNYKIDHKYQENDFKSLKEDINKLKETLNNEVKIIMDSVSKVTKMVVNKLEEAVHNKDKTIQSLDEENKKLQVDVLNLIKNRNDLMNELKESETEKIWVKAIKRRSKEDKEILKLALGEKSTLLTFLRNWWKKPEKIRNIIGFIVQKSNEELMILEDIFK